ncbi:hypothetical protein [Nocardioides ultimimeridianus]
MAVRIEVDYSVLRDAEHGWGVVGDDLDGAVARMGLISGAGLPAPVRAEVDDFVHRWHREVGAIASSARSARMAFGLVGGDYRITDRHLAEQIRSLMPWGQRHDAIRQA